MQQSLQHRVVEVDLASNVLGEDVVFGRLDESARGIDRAFSRGQEKQMLKDVVDKSALRRRVGGRLGNSLDGERAAGRGCSKAMDVTLGRGCDAR
jgi:hypothetical protein